MNKRQRVMAAIRGEEVDRVPFAFWLHNFAQEYSATALADETLRLYKLFDWDFLKPQSPWHCFGEMWGLQCTASKDRAQAPLVTQLPVKRLADFGKLEPADPATGALAVQLEAMKMVRDRVGPDVPVVATIFSPIMAAIYMVPGGVAGVGKLMREYPEELERGLSAIADTLAGYARLCVENGLDGIFYATNVANHGTMDAAQFARFERPYDLPILEAAQGAPMNIMHMCGSSILFDEFVDYPPAVFSWATTEGNPSLSQVQERTGRAVLGGLPAKPQIASMSEAALVEHARRSLEETGGRHHLLGPDCSINPDTPESLMHAVGKFVRGQH
jgi:uroporphyrinogen decarboxylase